MSNIAPNVEPDLPSEGEIYRYNAKKQNNNKPYLQNTNNDNSNTYILNQKGDIPFNKFFIKKEINNNSNQNIKNENMNNKESSLSEIKSLDSAAPPFVNKKKEININSIFFDKIEKKENIGNIGNKDNKENKENKENIENKKCKDSKLNLEPNKNDDDNSLKIQNTAKNGLNIINVKSYEKKNKCKDISILVLFYLSSITNNVLFYILQSIIDRLRDLY